MIIRYDLFQVHPCGQDRRGEMQETADGEYVAFEDVEHLFAPVCTHEDVIERVAKALASVNLSRSINLTRLVDGVSEYTLTYGDGSKPLVFDNTDDAYVHVETRKRRAQAAAVVAALTPATDAQMIEDGAAALWDVDDAAVRKVFNPDREPLPFVSIPDPALKDRYRQEAKACLAAAMQPPRLVRCPCTTFEQGEDCPVGYPSLLCSACDGKGTAPIDKVVALAAEMMKVAEQVDELEDPFAAWETIELLKSQNHPSTTANVDLPAQRSEAYASAEAAFHEYFLRNYPGPDTVIFDPKWHAPKLFAAAARALRDCAPASRVIDEFQVADPITGQWRVANPDDVVSLVALGRSVRVFLENSTLWNLVEDQMSIGRMTELSPLANMEGSADA